MIPLEVRADWIEMAWRQGRSRRYSWQRLGQEEIKSILRAISLLDADRVRLRG